MTRTAIAALLAAGLSGTAAAEAEQGSVSAAATYLYLATLCGENAGVPAEHAANARRLGEILRRLEADGAAAMKGEMAALNEIAEVEDRDGSVNQERKAAFCAENKGVLTALGPEVEMWIHDFSPAGEPVQ